MSLLAAILNGLQQSIFNKLLLIATNIVRQSNSSNVVHCAKSKHTKRPNQIVAQGLQTHNAWWQHISAQTFTETVCSFCNKKKVIATMFVPRHKTSKFHTYAHTRTLWSIRNGQFTQWQYIIWEELVHIRISSNSNISKTQTKNGWVGSELLIGDHKSLLFVAIACNLCVHHVNSFKCSFNLNISHLTGTQRHACVGIQINYNRDVSGNGCSRPFHIECNINLIVCIK